MAKLSLREPEGSGVVGFPTEGNGNPLQYPCLENLVDRVAWWAAVHGVAKSLTEKHCKHKGALWAQHST